MLFRVAKRPGIQREIASELIMPFSVGVKSVRSIAVKLSPFRLLLFTNIALERNAEWKLLLTYFWSGTAIGVW